MMTAPSTIRPKSSAPRLMRFADVRVCSTPAAVAGYPHLTVPMGFVDGLPIGLSFFGAAWRDADVLALGHAFEQAMPAFREPAFAA